jgi:hypothetical protein
VGECSAARPFPVTDRQARGDHLDEPGEEDLDGEAVRLARRADQADDRVHEPALKLAAPHER